ncbi:MAG: PfkB family carbohydrate kinase [Planctomycetota bacterium]
MNGSLTIVGLGEALFDIFGRDQRLGGAPLNAAVHAHALGQHHGVAGAVVSRLGDDPLGHQARQALADRGMPTDFLQFDPDMATGRVYVTTQGGEPSYEIVENVAWDHLQWDPDLEDLSRRCDALVFGSLAQRDAQSRSTIQRFVESARHAFKLFDVNLRQDYYDRNVLRRGLEIADAVKLNQDEFGMLDDLFGLADPADLLGKFELSTVALTRGAEGTRLITPGGQVDGAKAPFNPAPDADAVGAGDSVAASILVGRCLRMDDQAIADAANAVGAFVAGQPGATPTLPDELVARFA